MTAPVLGTGLLTKPRIDKRDPYVGNFRAPLAADVVLATQANRVIACGLNASGAVVFGAGQTGIIGVTIIPVGTDMAGNLLVGGINVMAGDICDVTKHGEIVNFKPNPNSNVVSVTITAGSGTVTPVVTPPGGAARNGSAFAFNGDAAALKTAIVAADDNLVAADVTTSGTTPNFSVTLPAGYALSFASGATVNAATTTPAAGTKYYAHSDGSIDTVSASGVYIGHTVEADRLILNVDA